MAFSNIKSNLSLALLITFILLQYQNIKSQSLVRSERISFSVTQFNSDNLDITLKGGATVSNGVLRLTKTDQYGKPLTKNIGHATHVTPIHIWDKTSGKVADFSTSFVFSVKTDGSTLHGDGFVFFLGPLQFDIPQNSSGGYLGLFNPQTALIPSQNPIVAFEFDSFTNGWDPASPSQFPHIGIDLGSINSVATANWPINFVPNNAVGEVSIYYNSELRRLSVSVYYPSSGKNATSISAGVDLRSVLPEWVRVGFSASTGELVETHDILNWSFESAL